jgi:hypothetical protein
MKKGNISPALVNKTEKMSVPATKLGMQEMPKEGKVEYPRGKAEGDKAPNTRRGK